VVADDDTHKHIRKEYNEAKGISTVLSPKQLAKSIKGKFRYHKMSVDVLKNVGIKLKGFRKRD